MVKNGTSLRKISRKHFNKQLLRKLREFKIEEYGNSFRLKKRNLLMIKVENLSRSTCFTEQVKLILKIYTKVRKVLI
jgi:hypothetical protein